MKILLPKILLTGLASLFCMAIAAQINLVPNPSFEEMDSCPQWIGDFFVKNWRTANIATPDYFNSCSTGQLGVPDNAFGNIIAKNGKAYVGLYMFNDSNTSINHREYIQCKLIEPLTKDEVYDISFFISLAQNSINSCDNIGLLVTDTIVDKWTTQNLTQKPQVRFDENNPITKIGEWKKKTNTYKSEGNEQYITIGYFFENTDVFCTMVSDSGVFETYYYIDDISICKKKQPFEMPSAFTPNDDGINDSYYPVYFDKTLSVQQFRVYNQWGELIHNNPNLPWDGKYNGLKQPQDVYTYYVYINLSLPDNLKKNITYKKTGSFTLLQ